MTKIKIDKDYLETHYEIVAGFYSNPNSPVLKEIEERVGRGGLWELAKELTDEFETIHKDREWDGEYFDELDNFIVTKLYE